VVVVVVGTAVVVTEAVDGAIEVEEALEAVVEGTEEATVDGATDDPGRVGTAAETSAVVVVVVVVLVEVVVLVVATVRGGAVSVTVELPPPRTPPPAEPSPMPRALVMTEPSGRTMMSPSEPPGLIQILCSSTVTSMGPVPGIAMV
jgi:hypothetical protein